MNQHEPGRPEGRPGAEAALDQAWHDASDELPPEPLDAAILAAAHRSVADARVEPVVALAASERTPGRRSQWQPLAVAAAVAGIAFTLVQVLPRESRVASPALEQPQVESPDFVAADAGEPAASAKSVREQAVPAAAGPSEPRRAPPREVQEVPAPAVEPVPAAGASAPLPNQADLAFGKQAAGPAAAAAPARSVESSASNREDVRAGVAVTDDVAARERSEAEPRPDPIEWSARIAALHAAGDLDRAAASLRSFRAAYERADDFLPAELRDWARTVER